MKKLAAAMLSIGLLAGTCGTAMAAEPEVYYNGFPLELNQPAIIQDGRTLFAMRDMAEQMNMDVQWDNATRWATVSYKDTEVKLFPDLHRVLVNGEEQKLDVGPQIINDRIYLPVRYLFEMLDCDVFYRQYENGHSVVSVNTRDAYMNYIQKNGQETKVVRNIASTATDNPVVMTDDGNVLELYVEKGKVKMSRTTQTLSRVDEKEEPAIFHTAITDVIELNDVYYAVLDEKQSSHYIGSAYHPNGDAFIKEIYTPQGEFAFYGSEAYVDVLALEGKEGFTSKTVKGYMLNIGGAKQPIKDTSYAFSNQKGYGFLTDGQLLLIANVKGEGYKVLSCNQISDTMKDGLLFSNNGEFYAIGSDVTAEGNAEIFVTSYTAQGMKANSYVPVSNLCEKDGYRYLNIIDSVQIGDKAYMLLQTNLGKYLACYDLTAHTFKAETLNKPYERFVQAKGSWQLYYCDDENYYFLEMK